MPRRHAGHGTNEGGGEEASTHSFGTSDSLRFHDQHEENVTHSDHLEFLGFVLDLNKMTISLPNQKLRSLRGNVESNKSHDLEEMLERKGKQAPASSQNQDNLLPIAGFQQPKPINQAGPICPFSPYRLVLNNGMVQLTFPALAPRIMACETASTTVRNDGCSTSSNCSCTITLQIPRESQKESPEKGPGIRDTDGSEPRHGGRSDLVDKRDGKIQWQTSSDCALGHDSGDQCIQSRMKCVLSGSTNKGTVGSTVETETHHLPGAAYSFPSIEELPTEQEEI